MNLKELLTGIANGKTVVNKTQGQTLTPDQEILETIIKQIKYSKTAGENLNLKKDLAIPNYFTGNQELKITQDNLTSILEPFIHGISQHDTYFSQARIMYTPQGDKYVKLKLNKTNEIAAITAIKAAYNALILPNVQVNVNAQIPNITAQAPQVNAQAGMQASINANVKEKETYNQTIKGAKMAYQKLIGLENEKDLIFAEAIATGLEERAKINYQEITQKLDRETEILKIKNTELTARVEKINQTYTKLETEYKQYLEAMTLMAKNGLL